MPAATIHLPDSLDVFPLRDTVVFPGVPAQLSSARPHTIGLITRAIETGALLCLLSERRPSDAPAPEDMYQTGTAARIQRMWHLPDGSVRVLVQSICRVEVIAFLPAEAGLRIHPRIMESIPSADKDLRALSSGASSLFQKILSLTPNLPDELQIAALNIDDPGQLADFIAFHLNLDLSVKQALLESGDPATRLERLTLLMSQEVEVLELGVRIRSRVQSELDRSRKDHLIREQIRALQRELGEGDARQAETEALKVRIADNPMPGEAHAEAERELHRLSRLPQGAPEYAACRAYLDYLTELPWSRQSPERLDLVHARQLLDADHLGLDAVKERILDELAVYRLGAGQRGPVMCLSGPPGVGKTSLGQAIAQALGRRFVRVALGGVRDEAELRGHRRTYLNAMPGRIIQGIHRAGMRNPVLMFDEIDKLGTGGTGDPASALLEILDPAQNAAFLDHYLNVPFDLSRVFFIATANALSHIPDALRDRLEIVEIPGYMEMEKAAIARKHILPRQRSAHGLTPRQILVRAAAVRQLIACYTREPGLRNLERALGTLCRKAARQVAEGHNHPLIIDAEDLSIHLGPPPFSPDLPDHPPVPGLAPGLAATYAGGQVFFVEATAMAGARELILTGHLGDVMKESARAALSCIRTRICAWGINAQTWADSDIHIHMPAAAVPKDGPSAGLAIAVCLASLFTRRPVKQKLAFTGEITLTGRVLRVGAIQDKLLAAHRAGIRQVVLPEANRADAGLLPDQALRGLRLSFVNTLDEALYIALGIAAT